ncbi:MAG: superoxide dismutase [Fe], partial [Alphaproteobacteria bacterium]|nr:superoxide dismutase [Fe] [Alphaproteobacteria bacterium]
LPLGFQALFNIDVWEHAYYLDYQNLRQKYVKSFIQELLHI